MGQGNPPSSASETVEGLVELATQAEVDAAVDDSRFITPAKLKATTIGSVTATNFSYALDTTTQGIAVADTYQDYTFTTNGQLDGWTHTPGSSDFVCNKTGKYLITVEINVEKSGGGNLTVACQGVVNGVEVVGSHFGMDITANNTTFIILRTFIADVTSGQTLKIQIAANSTNVSALPGPNPGSSTTPISGTLNLARLA